MYLALPTLMETLTLEYPQHKGILYADDTLLAATVESLSTMAVFANHSDLIEDAEHILLNIEETTNKLHYEEHKSRALAALAIAQAENGLFKRAKKTAKEISWKGIQAEVFGKIAISEARADLFNEAVNTVNNINGGHFPIEHITSVLSQIGKLQAEKGLLNEARVIFDQALKSAYIDIDINIDYKRTIGLAELAQIQTQVGFIDDAKSVFKQAKNFAYKCSEEEDAFTRYTRESKSNALATIAIAQAETGLLVEAIETFNEICPIYSSYKINALTEIAKTLIKKGNMKEAENLFEQTKTMILEKNESKSILQDSYLGEIAVAQVKTGLFKEAKRNLNEIESEDIKKNVLMKIAIIQAENGYIEEAIETTELIDVKSERYKVLSKILVLVGK